MNRVYWCLLALLLLSGCASPLSSGVGSATALEFKTSERDGTPFRAVAKGQVIAGGQARGGSVFIQLPSSIDVGPCVSLHDAKGKNVFPNGASIYTAVRSELIEATYSLQRVNSELASSRRTDPRLLLASARERLSGNRAFSNQQCSRPVQRPIPRRPDTRCTSHQECLQEGAAICFTRYIGERGCGAALSEFRVPGLLSSPSCAATAAKLAGEKYEMGDAVVDAIVGAIEDAGANLRQSDSIFDNLFGLAIGAGAEVRRLSQARSCTDSFIRQHFGPLETWQSNVRDITSEPDRLLASCQADRTNLPSLEAAVTNSPIPGDIDRLQARIAEIERQQRSLRVEKRPLEFCRPG